MAITNTVENALDLPESADVDTSPGRSLDTVFTPNADRPVEVSYACRVTSNAGDTDQGRITLLINGSEVGRMNNHVASTDFSHEEGQLSGLVPAGHTVELRTTVLNATPAFALDFQREVTL